MTSDSLPRQVWHRCWGVDGAGRQHLRERKTVQGPAHACEACCALGEGEEAHYCGASAQFIFAKRACYVEDCVACGGASTVDNVVALGAATAPAARVVEADAEAPKQNRFERAAARSAKLVRAARVQVLCSLWLATGRGMVPTELLAHITAMPVQPFEAHSPITSKDVTEACAYLVQAGLATRRQIAKLGYLTIYEYSNAELRAELARQAK